VGDLPLASWASEDLAALEAAGKVSSTAVVLGPVQLALPAVAYCQQQPPLVIALDRAQIG
jgi:hypothetical protein